jgi:hypothetical protein
MSDHPYRSQPDRAFWSKGVAAAFTASDLATHHEPLFRHGDKVMSAGSCFAANLVPYLEQAGFTYSVVCSSAGKFHLSKLYRGLWQHLYRAANAAVA